MKTVYVAGPYTKGDVAVNVRNAIELQSFLYDEGFHVFNPLLTHFVHLVFPREYGFWLKEDLAWLKKCDILVRLPGESSGAEGEIAEAEKLGIPVYRMEGELRDKGVAWNLCDWLSLNDKD
jgi:hypothetical protein